jgi:hypothetical protein
MLLLAVIVDKHESAPQVIAFDPQVKVPLDVIEAAENVPLAVILSVFKSPHVAAFIPQEKVPDELTDAHASAPHVIAFVPQEKVPDALMDVHATAAHVMGWSTMVLQ